MKLFDFYNSGPLDLLRIKMGASLLDDISLKLKKINEITIEELEQLTSGKLHGYLSDCKVEVDGTLSYKGNRVVVYIHDRHQYNDQWELPKLHISLCSTIGQKNLNDAYNQKYVFYQPKEDNDLFPMRIFINGIMNDKFVKLDVCKLCLENIKWNGYRNRGIDDELKRNIFKDFTLTKFFEKYPKRIINTLPLHTPSTIPINQYPINMNEHKKRLIEKRGYKCEGINCGRTDVTLEVHHKNGIRYINEDYNLELLCHSCHQKHHSHY